MLDATLFLCALILVCVNTESNLTFFQGEQKSPGIIPLAVKDVFSIIQEVTSADLHICQKLLTCFSCSYSSFPSYDSDTRAGISSSCFVP